MKTYQLNGVIADFDFHNDWLDYCGPKSLKAFLSELKAGEKAVIEINSPGGYVIHGVEMANAIKNSKAHLIAHVTGMAASMASVVACACDEIQMEEASFMMIHDPWAYAEGNAAELRKEAQLLEQMKKVCMSFYLGKFEKSEEELSALMSEETWYTGKECLENGLKCEVIPAAEMRAAAKLDENRFSKMPEAAKRFVNFHRLSEEDKAMLEQARAEQLEAEKAAEEESFKARYQGASKKINEFQAKIGELEKAAAAKNEAMAAMEKKLGEANEKIAALEKAAVDVTEFKGKISELESALAERDASVSKLTGELDEAKSNLAAKCEQVEQLEKAKALLTGGGIFTPNEPQASYAAKMDAAKTPEEREELRAMKLAGKIK